MATDQAVQEAVAAFQDAFAQRLGLTRGIEAAILAYQTERQLTPPTDELRRRAERFGVPVILLIVLDQLDATTRAALLMEKPHGHTISA